MPPAASHLHSTWNATLRTILGGALLVTLVLLAFVWPTATSKVHDLPIAVVGTGPQAQTVTDKLKSTGTFSVQTRDSRDEAVDAIERRQVYGAVVVGSSPADGGEVLTASAASPVVSQMMQGVSGQLSQAAGLRAAGAKQQAAAQAAQAGGQAAAAQASYQTLLGVQQNLPEAARAGLKPQLDGAKAKADDAAAAAAKAKEAVDAVPTPTVTTTDVVPLSSHDSRGAGLALAALPIAMGGMFGGLLISLLLVGPLRRLVALVGYSILGSFGMMALMTWAFKLLPGAWWGTWGIFALALIGTGAAIVGLHSLLGGPGIPIGAVLTMLIGNPLSSSNAPIEFMAKPWGTVGQYFVPGAALDALRDHSYFPKVSMWHPLLVLLGWAAVGLLLMLTGHFRDQEIVHLDGYVEPDDESGHHHHHDGAETAPVVADPHPVTEARPAVPSAEESGATAVPRPDSAPSPDDPPVAARRAAVD